VRCWARKERWLPLLSPFSPLVRCIRLLFACIRERLERVVPYTALVRDRWLWWSTGAPPPSLRSGAQLHTPRLRAKEARAARYGTKQ